MSNQPRQRRILGAATPALPPDTPWTLIVNGYCHLCDDMRRALAPYGLIWRELEIDTHPELEERWGELVPVLLYGDNEVCHYHLDTQRLEEWLRQAPATPPVPG